MAECPLCQTEVDENDEVGAVSVHVDFTDPKFPVTMRAAHRECLLRSVVGGIGHLRDHRYWCEIMNDPDGGMTYRESALQVALWVEKYGGIEPGNPNWN